MKIIFFGTPEFAVPFLKALVQDGRKPVAIVSQPDRPVGRMQTIGATPVKRCAGELDSTTLQPEDANGALFLEQLRGFSPDLFVVVAFGQILSKQLLDIPRLGTVNVHPSLLPKYRGAAPLQEVILRGDAESGVTIMLMDEKMDHGPILFQKSFAIAPNEHLQSLQEKAIVVGTPLLLKAITALQAGAAEPLPQNHSDATYTRMLTRDSGKLDFSKPTVELERMVRALNPWPGVWTEWRGKRLKILDAKQSDFLPDKKNVGELFADSKNLFVRCADGALQITKLQPEGKSAMTADEFINGYLKM